MKYQQQEVVYAIAGRYELVQGWYELLLMCNDPPLDQKLFKKKLDAWAKEWSRSGCEIQGYVSEQISLGNSNKCLDTS